MNGAATGAITVAFVFLIGWRLYRRMRKLVGRQPSRTWRHALGAILFPLVLAMLAVGAWFSSHDALLALAGGIAGGVALAIWGIRLTTFEKTDEGWFYTPNARIGIALIAVLAVRIAYRLFELSRQYGLPLRGASNDAMRSPLTLLIVGALLSYYAAYSAGLLRWRLKGC
jgi:heme A synthase